MSKPEILKKIQKLKDALDLRGISESGREYRVYNISSCHVNENSLNEALYDLFEELNAED